MTATNHNWSQAGIINKFLPWYVHSHWTRWIELKMKWANTYLPYRNLYQCNIDLSLLSLTDGPPLSWIIICPLMTNLSPILIVLQRTICIQNALTGSFYQENKLFLLCFYISILESFTFSSFLTVSPKPGKINVVCMSCQLCCEAPLESQWRSGQPEPEMMETLGGKCPSRAEVTRVSWVNGPWSISDKPPVQFYRLFQTRISLYSESWNKNIPETFHQIKTLSNFVQTLRLQGYLENLQ